MAKTPYINDHGTLQLLEDDAFRRLKEHDGSNYRLLKDGEFVPRQAVEGDPVAVTNDPPIEPPDAEAIRRLRRQQAKNDGA